MEFGLSEQDRDIADTVRTLLAARSSRERLRDVLAGHDPGIALFDDIAKAGWLATGVPEEQGGLGLGALQMAVVSREAGRALLPEPLSSAVLAVTLLAATGYDDPVVQDALDGGVRVALVHHAGGERWTADDAALLGITESGGRLDGSVDVALDADRADLLLVPARAASGGASWWLVPRGAEGVSVRRVDEMDPLAHLPEVTMSGCRGTALPGSLDTLILAAQLGALLMAAELIGTAEEAVRRTVEYTGQREQFGKPVGSFQALKHGLAETHTLTHMASNAVWYAADAVDRNRPDRARAVSVAKAAAGDAARAATAQMVQFHGGIGFTWEHDAHLFFKRALWMDMLFGDAAEHRDHLVRLATR